MLLRTLRLNFALFAVYFLPQGTQRFFAKFAKENPVLCELCAFLCALCG